MLSFWIHASRPRWSEHSSRAEGAVECDSGSYFDRARGNQRESRRARSGRGDYLAKPFAIEELAARLCALIRRQTGENLVRYRIQDLTLDVASRIARRGSRRIDLTGRDIVEKLLLLSRADAGTLTLTKEILDFSALCNELVEDAEILARPKHITGEFEITPDVKVLADESYLRRVLLNLLG